ncbi:MAG TPA: SPOR domain-containing protein [Terriglobales bacterium]
MATKAQDKDTEITLDVFKLLALFFGLVALCGVFFGLGYAWGAKSAKANAVDSTPVAASNVQRPSAGKIHDNESDSGSATKSKPEKTQVASKEPSGDSPETERPAEGNTPAQPAATPGGTYFVQVAAVSKQEDADALVDALKRKQYPAMISGGSSDKLFHVQLGPYGDIKDAEAMRIRLVTDGYNPILKK